MQPNRQHGKSDNFSPPNDHITNCNKVQVVTDHCGCYVYLEYSKFITHLQEYLLDTLGFYERNNKIIITHFSLHECHNFLQYLLYLPLAIFEWV